MNFQTVFDIETGPLDEATILARCPEPKIPKNIKDPEKIQARKDEHRTKVVDTAALDARLGRVVAIGFTNSIHLIDEQGGEQGGESLSLDNREALLLRHFWNSYEATHEVGGKLIGFNIFGFDLPFLVRRSLLLGVEVPRGVMERNRYWSPTFVDLLELWQCGNRQDYVKLEDLGKAFGVGGKTDGVGGADFHKLLFSGKAKDRQLACKYLYRDVELTAAVAGSMGVL
jgi:hypothetical protein